MLGFHLVTLALAVGAHAGGHSENDSAALAEALSGFERSGEMRMCLSTRRIDQIRPVDDENWLITTRGRDTYLNTVSGGCQNADSSFTHLLYRTNGSLCRGDIVRVVDSSSGASYGACGLGSYERLTPVE